MKDTGHVTEMLTIVFFDFLGVFHHFSINIRTEVRFLFALRNERTLVACNIKRDFY